MQRIPGLALAVEWFCDGRWGRNGTQAVPYEKTGRCAQSSPTMAGGVAFLCGMEYNRGQKGWRYVGFIPTKQRGTGHIQEMDLIFEKKDK